MKNIMVFILGAAIGFLYGVLIAVDWIK